MKLLVALIFLFGIQSSDDTYYTKTVPNVVIPPVTTTSATIQLSIKEGWKWNDKYPNKFSVVDQGSASCFSGAFLSVVVENNKVNIKTEVAAGDSQCCGELQLKAKFGLCNEKRCVILKDSFRMNVCVEEHPACAPDGLGG